MEGIQDQLEGIQDHLEIMPLWIFSSPSPMQSNTSSVLPPKDHLEGI